MRFGIMRSGAVGQDLIFEDLEFDRWGSERYEFDKIRWNPSRFPQVELARNFCNKLWNACRFRQMQGQGAAGVPPADHSPGQSPNFRQDAGSTFEVQGEINPALLTSDDKWILLKLDQAIREID